MSEWVLDASAVLAYLQAEPGKDVVEEALLDQASISAVNLAEVVTKLYDGGMPESAVREVLDALPLVVFPLDADAAVSVGLLIKDSKPHGLSLGDRACLALAAHLGCAVLTADRVWSHLSLPVEVQLIRS